MGDKGLSPTLAFSTGSTLKEVKQARTSAGATHVWPEIAAQGSDDRGSLVVGRARPGRGDREKKRVTSETSERVNMLSRSRRGNPRVKSLAGLVGAFACLYPSAKQQ